MCIFLEIFIIKKQYVSLHLFVLFEKFVDHKKMFVHYFQIILFVQFKICACAKKVHDIYKNA